MKVTYQVPQADAPPEQYETTVFTLPPRVGDRVEHDLISYRVEKVIFHDLEMTSATVVLSWVA